MSAPRKTGIPIVDAAVADAVEIARAERLAEQATASAAAERAGSARELKSTKGLGIVTKVAITAGFAVTHDTLGTSAFPNDRPEMARAIADKALELELVPPDQPLNPESRPVREVAESLLRGVTLMRTREVQKERKENPPEAAGSRRHKHT